MTKDQKLFLLTRKVEGPLTLHGRYTFYEVTKDAILRDTAVTMYAPLFNSVYFDCESKSGIFIVGSLIFADGTKLAAAISESDLKVRPLLAYIFLSVVCTVPFWIINCVRKLRGII
jgi:hypothetical protein